jgi:hypothetical protein
MSDAAKSARGAFTDIKSGSDDMAGSVSGNMMQSRQGVMLLGEEFGVHLPRGLTTFISSLGPVGAAMEAAFPFIAIAVAATLLIEHLVKMHEAGEKLTQDQVKFGTATQMAFNSLDQKLLQAQIRTDELRNDHIGALKKQLELIDKQSLAELAQQFDQVAKTADAAFAELKKSWYQFGSGSAGAKHSLEEFTTTYESLLAKGDKLGASNLLAEKVSREERILDLQKQIQANSGSLFSGPKDGADISIAMRAQLELKKSGAKYDDDAIRSQEAILKALNDQVAMQQHITTNKDQAGLNAKLGASNEADGKASEAARQAAEHKNKMGELAIAAEREQAAVALATQQASIAERLASDIALADKEFALAQQTNTRMIAALDKSGKDYNNQLKALHDKAEEETAQHGNTIAALTGKATEEQAKKDVTDLEQAEREKINATMQGTAARLAAIDAAIKEEQSRNLQASSFFKELNTQRVEVIRQAAEEESKLRAAAGKEAADNDLKMGELALAAARQHQALLDSARRVSDQQRVQEETNFANQEFALKLTAMQREAAALDKGAKDYNNKLKEMQDKEKQLVQQHENEVTAIRTKAEMERNSRVLSAEQHFNDAIASGLTQTLMGHKSFAATMSALGSQVASGLMENAMKAILAHDMTKPHEAAAAARAAYLDGQKLPFPASLIAAPAMGALAFAAVMAFENGTDAVPGVGRGDSTPALLTPGEGVVPGGVMDGLRNMVKSGGMGGGTHTHLHPSFAPTIHAVDATGVDRMLQQHGDKFERHMTATLRRMNK